MSERSQLERFLEQKGKMLALSKIHSERGTIWSRNVSRRGGELVCLEHLPCSQV